MRLKDIAYEIGITRQELRRELQKTDFGVDTSAKDIPDGLAHGVIRFFAPKYKKQKAELDRKEAARIRADALNEEGSEDASDVVIKKREVHEDEPELESETKNQSELIVDKEEDKEEKEEVIVAKEPEVKKPSGPIRFRTASRVAEGRKKEEEKKEEEKKEKEARAKKKKEEDELRKAQREIESRSRPAMSPRGSGGAAARGDRNYRGQDKKKGSTISIHRKIEVSNRGGGAQGHKASKRFRTREVLDQNISEEERIAMLAEEQVRRQLEDESFKASQSKRRAKMQTQQNIEEKIVKKEGLIEIGEIITVKEFSEKTGLGASKLISVLLKNGIMATMNSGIDYETWSLLSEELEVQLKQEEKAHSVEEIIEGNLEALMKDETENLQERPPVIVVMGHVDHGKTSILDFYRDSHVVDKESGGITQHIGAYQIEKRKKLITFLDTPGHEAFTEMRARGARVTDIAILVVAADEGIKVQTIEAINHAKAAKIPVIVAINKMDKEGADPERVKGELMGHELTAEDYGGDIMMVPVSAKTGDGMENLLDAILLQSEILELKANPDRLAIASVVESHLDKSLGPVATIVVNTGTLKMGSTMLAGSKVGKVRTIIDWEGKRIRVAGPSSAVQISGFEETPKVGDIIQVVASEKLAREKAAQIAEILGEREGHAGVGMGEILSRIQSGQMDLLKVVLKADTQGSIEAIKQMFAKIDNKEVGVKIIHSAVGGVTESDVMIAAASQGIVLSFHAGVPARVSALAERENVEVQAYSIIYELVDDIKKILTGMLVPEEVEIETGKAQIKMIFLTTKKKQIIGARVLNGLMKKGGSVRITRKEEVVAETKISNLKSFDKVVEEVKADNECGIEFPKRFELEEGDEIVCFTTEQKMKTL